MDGTLTFAAVGNYVLKLRNTQEWSSGKIGGVQLSFVEEIASEVEYFLTGTINEWALKDENYKFVVNPEADGEYMLLGVDLPANAGIKVVSSEGTWYPDGMGNEKVIEEAGKYDIYFRPDGTGGDDWHCKFFYVAKQEPTGLQNTTVAGKVVKTIENGQVVIIKNGVRYNVQGAIMK